MWVIVEESTGTSPVAVIAPSAPNIAKTRSVAASVITNAIAIPAKCTRVSENANLSRDTGLVQTSGRCPLFCRASAQPKIIAMIAETNVAPAMSAASGTTPWECIELVWPLLAIAHDTMAIAATSNPPSQYNTFRT